MRFALGDGGSLKDRVLRSGLWVGVSEASVALLGVIRSIALARLLTPDMFGLMGLAMIVVRAVETFTRPGVAQALIARQRNFEEASGTAFTMLTIRGVLLALCLIVAAPWIAKFYDRPQLGWLLGALSGVFVLGGFNNINLIARQRELDFRNISLLGQATNLVGTTLTITLAWMLRSVWALVIGQLAQVGLNALLSYYFVPGRVTFAWDRGIARELMSYGKFITGSSIVLYIATEIDSAVIGKVLGTEQLGFYTLAFTIAHLATTNLSKIASSIMMPAYSKLQTDIPALRAAFLRTLSLLMLPFLGIPLGLATRRNQRNLGIAVGVVTLVIYNNVLNFGEQIASAGRMSSFVALWVPFLVFSAASIWLFWTVSARPRENPVAMLIGSLDRAKDWLLQLIPGRARASAAE